MVCVCLMQSCTQWQTYNPSNSLNLVNHFHELIIITVWYIILNPIYAAYRSLVTFWAWSPFCSPWLSTLGIIEKSICIYFCSPLIITLFDRWTGLKATNEHLHNPLFPSTHFAREIKLCFAFLPCNLSNFLREIFQTLKGLVC